MGASTPTVFEMVGPNLGLRIPPQDGHLRQSSGGEAGRKASKSVLSISISWRSTLK
jgi:hypothetical protein